jgi:mono/diheme cytochrome c family protein
MRDLSLMKPPAWTPIARCASLVTLRASIVVFSCWALSPSALASPADDFAAENVYFESQVRPLLESRCLECHGADSEPLAGNLRLDSAQGWMQGGDLGASIVPSDPDASLLVQAVRHTHAQLQMPPEGRLSENEIAVLVEWVRRGAFDPRSSDSQPRPKRVLDLQVERQHWALQPITRPTLPDLDIPGQNWVRNPIDALVWQQYQAQGLHPVAPANRIDLIRRATIDLTGLPPTAAEVDDFVADGSPEAWCKVVDRLLATSEYGERWGRHWLDLARYADSNGMDENIAHGNAWRYRDYVVKSMIDDKPFNEFVLEQLAGDRLEPLSNEADQHQRLIATAYLSLGPKVLAEVDETKMEMDIVDEQVDTMGRTFMALTLGCARCHDHKFDPIRTADYYALAGIFKSTKTMEHFTKIAKWNETTIATQSDLDQQQTALAAVEQTKKQIGEIVAQANSALLDSLETGASLPENPESQYPAETIQKLMTLREQQKQLESAVPELPSTMAVVDYPAATDLAVHIRGSHLSLGDVVPRALPAVFTENLAPNVIQTAGSGRLELAQWLVSPSHPLTSRVIVNRIWNWHFGKGIVSSVDNFGLTGDQPTNPQLLDWLAVELMDSQWSLKHLHRLILTSQTYQLGTYASDTNQVIDPEGLFFWRREIRRLDAESIRDALLSVSGLLDRRMGGSHLHVKNREFLFDHTSKDMTRYDVTRRSIYLPVIRNHLYEVFQLFDFPDASIATGERATSTVASQALMMMNSDFAFQAAEAMAQKLLSENDVDNTLTSNEGRIRAAYRLAFGRPPNQIEIDRDVAFVSDALSSLDPKDAWRLYCQAMLASNEFLHVK